MHKTAMLVFFIILIAVFAQGQSNDVPRYEIGVQYTVAELGATRYFTDSSDPSLGAHPCGFCSRALQGAGVRFVGNFNRFVAFDAEWNSFPEGTGKASDGSANAQYGGRASNGLFGIKAGVRRRKFGVFARGAQGFLSYSKALPDYPNDDTAYRAFHFQCVAGGVLEYYPSRKIAIRYDALRTFTQYGFIWENEWQSSLGVLYRF